MYKQASRRYFAHELRFSEPAKIANKIIGSLDFKEPTCLGHMSEEAVYHFIQSQPILIEQRVESQVQSNKTHVPSTRGASNPVKRVKTAIFISGWSSLKLAAKLNMSFTPLIVADASEKTKEFLAWSDLLRCFPLIDSKSYGRLFLLMQKHCPDDIAIALLGGKVTQESIANFIPCFRSTIGYQLKKGKEKASVAKPKPQLADMDFEDS